MGAGYGVICGIGVSILQFVLGLATYYGPWSVLLDYVLPLAVCGLTPLMKTQKIGNLPICWGIVFVMFLKYLSHFASGAFSIASDGSGYTGETRVAGIKWTFSANRSNSAYAASDTVQPSSLRGLPCIKF